MEALGPFMAGVAITVFVVFLITRIARKKYDVVGRDKSGTTGSGTGGRDGGRNIHLK